jgi:hypothetical protein
VGVVGAGSVGCIVAETLARTGIERIVLLDYDGVEECNLDRLLHAGKDDIGCSKVEVLARALRRSATADEFEAEPLEWSVVEEPGFRAALDCDVLFSCVDRPWPRSVLNLIAYAYLIPVIDGGIQVEVHSDGALRQAGWRAHVAAPGRRCLECLGQYDPGQVSVERDGYLDQPSYVRGLRDTHPSKANQNVFAFSLSAAALEVLQLLTMVVAPVGVSNPGAQHYHFVPGILDNPDYRACEDSCLYPGFIARGERCGITATAAHGAAASARAGRVARNRQRKAGRSWCRRLGRALSVFLHES